MDPREAAPQRGSVPVAFPALAQPVALGWHARPTTALAWATCASTFRRLQRGEGALLAVNLSLIAAHDTFGPTAFVEALVSVFAIGIMYAFNDLHDAPTDSNNPKKDPALIAVYLDHRHAARAMIAALKVAVLTLAWTTLSTRATLAVAGTLGANVVYSAALKGVPVADVVWCGLWGALYACIVSDLPATWLLVGLMTAVCHLFQALDDRDADAANAVTTTAVRSRVLSTVVLAVACLLLCMALRARFGDLWAVTGLIPLAIHLTGTAPRSGWLWTKAYFAVMWLAVLGIDRAAG